MKDWTYFQATAALQKDSCFLWNSLIRYHLSKKSCYPKLLNGCSWCDRKFSSLNCFSVNSVTILLEHGNWCAKGHKMWDVLENCNLQKSVDGQADFRAWIFEGSCKSVFEKSPLLYVVILEAQEFTEMLACELGIVIINWDATWLQTLP